MRAYVSCLNSGVFELTPIDGAAMAALQSMEPSTRALELLKSLEQKGGSVQNPSGYIKAALRREGVGIPPPGQVPEKDVHEPKETQFVDPFSIFRGHEWGRSDGGISTGDSNVGRCRKRSRSARWAERCGRSLSPRNEGGLA